MRQCIAARGPAPGPGPSPDPKPSPARGYLGCYKDASNRDLGGYSFRSNGLTNGGCISECTSRGYAFAATQYRNACFCDNDYGAYGEATNCNMGCTGNPRETCGGTWANSVYRTGGSGQQRRRSDPPPRGKYLGCYTASSSRDLHGHQVLNSTTLTPESCIAECGRRGFPYAATQYGSACFCDTDFGSYGTANNCNMNCSGNSSQTCGGTWANSVYTTGVRR